MKLLHFCIFLLTFELFTTSCQGLPIGYTRGCNRRYLKYRENLMRKSLKTPWKPDKSEKLRSFAMVSCDCPEGTPPKPHNTVKCPPTEDDPEKWFVKVYQIPDTRPQRYILCSVREEEEGDSHLESTPYKSFDINQEFKRCTLQCDKDWLILRCTPYAKICPRVSRKNCATVFCTKFLQISEPEKVKNSVLSAVVQGKCPRYSAKK